MKKIIVFCFIVGSLLIALPPSVASYQAPEEPEYTALTPTAKPKMPPRNTDSLISEYSSKYGVSSAVMRKVIEGESNYRCEVYGDNGNAFGIAQFHKPTFQAFSKELGESLDYYSCHDQIKLMAWALSKGYGRHWTVFRNL